MAFHYRLLTKKSYIPSIYVCNLIIYNYYVSYYRDTFQHGGISLEEMMIPIVTMTGKKR